MKRIIVFCIILNGLWGANSAKGTVQVLLERNGSPYAGEALQADDLMQLRWIEGFGGFGGYSGFAFSVSPADLVLFSSNPAGNGSTILVNGIVAEQQGADILVSGGFSAIPLVAGAEIFSLDFTVPPGPVPIAITLDTLSGTHSPVISTRGLAQPGPNDLWPYHGLPGPPNNQPPFVNAGADIAVESISSVPLDAMVLDDGLPNPPGQVTLEWTLQSGLGQVVFEPNAFVQDPTVSFSQIGIYHLNLTVSDGAQQSTDTIKITAGNHPPIVSAGPDQEIWSGQTAQMAATITDEGLPLDPGEVTVEWDQVSGPGATLFSPSAFVEDPIVSFSDTGSYVLRVTADDGALTGFGEVSVLVKNRPPTVELCPSRSIRDLPANVRLNATINDDGFPDPPGSVEVLWEQNEGPAPVTFDPNEFVVNPLMHFAASGQYRLSLYAHDGELETVDTIYVFAGSSGCCRGDLSNDGINPGQNGVIDFGDLNYFLSELGAASPIFMISPVPWNLQCADLSDLGICPGQNGRIDLADLNYFLGVFSSYAPTFSGPCLP
jgi:hypothetical protein